MSTYTLNIKAAAAYAGMSEMRIRNLLKEGRIEGEKQQLGDSEIVTWRTSEAAIDAYKTNGRKVNQNGKAWIIRLTKEQLEALLPTLEAMDIELENRFTYDAEKSKAYREAKKQKAASK